MDYTSHLQRAENLFEPILGYDNATPFEKCIILLRTHGWNYNQIQNWLGNPSKKQIRAVLLQYAPELIDLDVNKHKLKSPSDISIPEKRINGLLIKSNCYQFDLDEFGQCTFTCDNGKVTFTDDTGYTARVSSYDERTQLAILYNIANELNINIK